jgi:2-polyprenyl-3-methyl-5-hydroxy-6-metoxy-1,4-benzoquinol methylase
LPTVSQLNTIPEDAVLDLTNADIIKAYERVPQQFIEEFGDQGDLTRQYLLNPALFALLGDVGGLSILDAGCGQGYLARLLAKQGASLTDMLPAI